ncbi:MAG TPA: hypothetical protein VHA09_02840 [Nitrososphaera sp.]|nr:hypothetical protein [Nitrososphaera sp.]
MGSHIAGQCGHDIQSKIPIFEIWSNDNASDYAAKISGQQKFLIKTSTRTEYTQLIYAAPYTEENLEGLAYIIDRIVTGHHNSNDVSK